MSERICLFAGTTEGRRIAEAVGKACELTVCVATEYGRVMLDGIDGLDIRSGRMDREEMAGFFREAGFDRVVDATHPYAAVVTENIRSAAEKTGVKYMRVLREGGGAVPGAVYVPDAAGAREYLTGKAGNILLTTGSKELADFKGIDAGRIWARVLPLASSLEECARAGIAASHIIAAQGPFTYEMDSAQLHMINARFLVTKDSGKRGGFAEKVRAAEDAGVQLVVIGRPADTEGVALDDALLELSAELKPDRPGIYIIGVGPGGGGELTRHAKTALDSCDAVIGARSVAEPFSGGKDAFFEFAPEKVAVYLRGHPSIRRAAILVRGDTGFFSAAGALAKALEEYGPEIVPGVSCVSALASRLKVSWDGAAIMSLHGRKGSLIRAVSRNKRLFLLTGGENGVKAVCERLCEYGLGGLSVTAGERLGYGDERISRGTAVELSGRDFDELSVMYIENQDAWTGVRIGIPDDEFACGGMPVTGAEARAVIMSKLELDAGSVVWDVGAGCGCVSVECALAAFEGAVYAIDSDPDAMRAIKENSLRFGTDNLIAVNGASTETLCGLPAPTHVFIGGGHGDMEDMIKRIYERNPMARVVAAAVTPKARRQVAGSFKALDIETEAVTVRVSKILGGSRYQGSVTVFTARGGSRNGV